MPKSKAIINIENVVAVATLNQKVDLKAVVKGYPGAQYRPEQFPGLVFRLKRPKTATLIFHSGKMVCTGAKSEKEARRAVMNVVKELKDGGIIIISKPELKIQNIVASASLGGKIDLEQAVSKLRGTKPHILRIRLFALIPNRLRLYIHHRSSAHECIPSPQFPSYKNCGSAC